MKGICPLCEEKGKAAEPCPHRICSKKGYHFIPAGDFETACREAAGAGGVLDKFIGMALGQYVIYGKIGEGGMGAVYRAWQSSVSRVVALKMISNMDSGENTLKRFKREARAIAKISHPNIVKIYDYGLGSIGGLDNIPYMALEFVGQARTLSDFIRAFHTKNRFAPINILWSVFRQITDAVFAAHQGGFIHRDIKPENIMIKETERHPHEVKILDFGLAKAVQGASLEEKITRTGVAVGTPAYIAPEQIINVGSSIDHRCDLYATGVMLFWSIFGYNPFRASNIRDVLVNKVHPAFDIFMWEDREKLPVVLTDFFKKTLARQPELRFPDMQAMQQALKPMLYRPEFNAWLGQRSMTDHLDRNEDAIPTEHIDLDKLMQTTLAADEKSSEGGGAKVIIKKMNPQQGNDRDQGNKGVLIAAAIAGLGIIALIIVLMIKLT